VDAIHRASSSHTTSRECGGCDLEGWGRGVEHERRGVAIEIGCGRGRLEVEMVGG